MISKYIKSSIKYLIYFSWIPHLYNFIIIKYRCDFKSQPRINGFLKVVNNKGIIKGGKNIKINSAKNINIIGGDIKTNFVVFPKGKIIIGDNVGISNSTIVSKVSITVEDNVLIGGSCKIYDTDFHSINVEERMLPYLHKKKKDKTVKNLPVTIKKGAWIGGHCIILKGVTIGVNSIVAAGSVVSKNIPDNEIWAGNPAKHIRKLDNPSNTD